MYIGKYKNQNSIGDLFDAVCFFCFITTTAFAFYFQVKFKNPNMALVPYVFISIIFLKYCFKVIPRSINLIFRPQNNIDLLIVFYIVTIYAKLFWLAFWGLAIYDLLRYGFLYTVPLMVYFVSANTNKNIHIVLMLFAVSLCALIIGVNFAYESYSKLALNRVPDFQFEAFKYSNMRMIEEKNIKMSNFSRIGTQYRAQGLMASHRATATWIALGMFAILGFLGSILSNRSHQFFLLIGFLILIVGLNFTAIISYITVYILILKKGMFSKNKMKTGFFEKRFIKLFIVVFITIMLLGIVMFANNPDFLNKILGKLESLSFFIFSDSVSSHTHLSYLEIVLQEIITFSERINANPIYFLFGMFPGAPGTFHSVGGDVGFLDTISFLGIIFYMICLIGIVKILIRYIQFRKYIPPTNDYYQLQFAMCTLVFILVMDGHYNVWLDKSVNILFFLSLGIIRRNCNLL